MNECNDSPCGNNTTCTNTEGSFTCSCVTGYQGDPYTTCSDINECANPALFTCHELASCVNNPGNYSCECNEGYIGDGTTICEGIQSV